VAFGIMAVSTNGMVRHSNVETGAPGSGARSVPRRGVVETGPAGILAR
jgi:hypothetical protein